MAKHKDALSYLGKLKLIAQSGITHEISTHLPSEQDDQLSIDVLLSNIFKVVNQNKNSSNMIFFVMYDIENNKVRNYIAKYLLKKGCLRIQKSIFLANLKPEIFQEIKNDLKSVQEVYENKDSIIIAPISVDYLKVMRIIGKDIDLDIVMNDKNTMFF